MLNLYNANNHNKNLAVPSQPAKAAPEGPGGKSKTPIFAKYVDPTGELPSQEFKWGIWYVSHKVLLYKIAIGSLVGLSAIFWLYSLWQWGAYLIFGLSADQQLARQLTVSTNYSVANQRYTALPLQVAGTEVLAGGVDRYDIVSEVANPNKNFLVAFDYYYTLGSGGQTQIAHTFLLPSESRPIAYLGYANGQPSGVNLVLENMQWQRVDPHQIPQVDVWQKDHLNFTVQNLNFIPYHDPNGPNAHIIRFQLTNDSAFGYNLPDFYVGLFDNSTMVGVLPLHLEKINSGETVSVDLRSFALDLNVTDVQVFPLINIYNKEVFLLPI